MRVRSGNEFLFPRTQEPESGEEQLQAQSVLLSETRSQDNKIQKIIIVLYLSEVLPTFRHRL
jgi:hypothetical protein